MWYNELEGVIFFFIGFLKEKSTSLALEHGLFLLWRLIRLIRSQVLQRSRKDLFTQKVPSWTHCREFHLRIHEFHWSCISGCLGSCRGIGTEKQVNACIHMCWCVHVYLVYCAQMLCRSNQRWTTQYRDGLIALGRGPDWEQISRGRDV